MKLRVAAKSKLERCAQQVTLVVFVGDNELLHAHEVAILQRRDAHLIGKHVGEPT